MPNFNFNQFEAIVREAIDPAVTKQFEQSQSLFDSLAKKKPDPHTWLTSLEAYADMIEGKFELPHLGNLGVSSGRNREMVVCIECTLAHYRKRRYLLQADEKTSIARYSSARYVGELEYIEGKIKELTENRVEGDSLTDQEINSRGYRIPIVMKPTV